MIGNFEKEKFRGSVVTTARDGQHTERVAVNRILVLICCLSVLAGCAAPAPQVVTRTVTVEVPVAVPCRAPQIDRPTWPLDVLPTDANDYEWARAALAEIEIRQAYEARLEGAVAGCR